MKTILPYLFVCISFFTNAQSEFLTGQIVNLDGDTLSGFIKNESDFVLGSQVQFKTSLKAKEKTYLPSTLRGFILEGTNHYQSINTYYYANKVKIESKAFCKILVLGELSLFKSQFGNRASEFVLYLVKNGKIVRLEEKQQSLKGLEVAWKKDMYSGKLKALIADCLEIDIKIPFSANIIQKLVMKYNRCKDSGIEMSVFISERTKIISHLIEGKGSVLNNSTAKNFLRHILQVGYTKSVLNSSLSNRFALQYGIHLVRFNRNLMDLKEPIYGIALPLGSIYANQNKKQTPYFGLGGTFYILERRAISPLFFSYRIETGLFFSDKLKLGVQFQVIPAGFEFMNHIILKAGYIFAKKTE